MHQHLPGTKNNQKSSFTQIMTSLLDSLFCPFHVILQDCLLYKAGQLFWSFSCSIQIFRGLGFFLYSFQISSAAADHDDVYVNLFVPILILEFCETHKTANGKRNNRPEEKELGYFRFRNIFRSRPCSAWASRTCRIVRPDRPEQCRHDAVAQTHAKHQYRYGKKIL